MLQPDFENKSVVALDVARKRVRTLDAELLALAEEESRLSGLRTAYPDDGTFDAEMEQIHARRRELQAERERAEADVETARRAKAEIEWKVELAEQRRDAEEYGNIGREMEAVAREATRVWNKHEAHFAACKARAQRAERDAARYNREPLEQLVAWRHLNLPTVFLAAFHNLARRAKTLEMDRLRDLSITPGGPPAVVEEDAPAAPEPVPAPSRGLFGLFSPAA